MELTITDLSSGDDPLLTPVQYLSGVGPARAAILAKLEIFTVGDLLWHLPRDVLDLSQVKKVTELVEGAMQSVRGVVCDLDARMTSSGKHMTTTLLDCEGQYVRASWFNQPWMFRKLQMEQLLLMAGKPKKRDGRWEFSHPQLQWLSDEDRESGFGVLPRYPLTEGIQQAEMRRLTALAVDEFADLVPEHHYTKALEKWKIVGIGQALHGLHKPSSVDEYLAGRRRLLWDDLFEFQVGLALRRRAWITHSQAPPIEITAKVDARIRRLFPFSLTEGQEQAICDVTADLATGHAMHRLIQADVGAGKTVIAIYALLAAVAGGWQGALMTPTELLATQHWDTLQSVLAQSRVKRALLTGRIGAKEQREVHAGLQSGDIQLVVGTQAIIQEKVKFANLGLVVIDEQHKFGVAQRATFSQQEGHSPHILVMTATPIPRSLCLTQFGDLDLTLVKDLPPGRQRVVTSRVIGSGNRQRCWDFIRQKLSEGRQLYIVSPRVDGSTEEGEQLGVEQIYRELPQTELSGFNVGMVHGQMDGQLRAETMAQFREGEIQALVATTVIEVGVDVPNATLMVILDAERFGLSQLHQLRGRIARGKYQGYCFLISDADTAESVTRLHAMEQTSDGFQIAEVDFEMRGPGDALGTRQSGSLPLRIADLIRDHDLLVETRAAAQSLLKTEAIDRPEFAPLKLKVLDRFGLLMDLQRGG